MRAAVQKYYAARRLLLLIALASGMTGCNSFGTFAGSHCVLSLPSIVPWHDENDVDWHFSRVRQAWRATKASALCPETAGDDWSEYNKALAGLLDATRRTCRFDPTSRLVIHDDGETVTIPIEHHDFAGGRTDFQKLYPAPTAHQSPLERHYACNGIGVPLVVVRCRNNQDPLEARFYPNKSAISATAVLRFDEDDSAVLEFYNPLARPSMPLNGTSIPIARDTTASLAWALNNTPRTYVTGFTHPDDPSTSSRLLFLEPYQPGKIPIVFSHGLLSDPGSMADLVNDLRSAPGFSDTFQVWYYRYATGQGILQSAAILREELKAAVTELDPAAGDSALHRIVLVGHSMGGLISKLQVTHSDDRIWRQVANQPLDNIVTDDRTRAELARLTYFDPSPNVTRVIFIASPHRGGLPYSSVMGNCASRMVDTPRAQEAMHAQLVAHNPGVFQPWVQRRFPTSIDMLEADSPLLNAMQEMRLSEQVTLHNIIGESHCISLQGPSDSVVAVSSALHPNCQSEIMIRKSHTKVHHSSEAAHEVLRILAIHRESCAVH